MHQQTGPVFLNEIINYREETLSLSPGVKGVVGRESAGTELV
jgi:hypothetical protein